MNVRWEEAVLRISTDGSGWLLVEFGTGYEAKVLDDARAIIDLSNRKLPAQIELVSVVDWAARFCGEKISIPSEQDLRQDAWCLRYDSEVDCLTVKLYPDSRQLAPFRNREVLATLSIDHGDMLCGIAVHLLSSEVAEVLQRTEQ